MPLLWNPHAKRVLMIGLGGGSTFRAFNNYYPDIHMDTVELDPEVAKVAKRFFHVKETPKHKIYFGDGRNFLRLNKKHKYDAILMDAYASNQYGSSLLQSRLRHLLLGTVLTAAAAASAASSSSLLLKKHSQHLVWGCPPGCLAAAFIFPRISCRWGSLYNVCSEMNLGPYRDLILNE